MEKLKIRYLFYSLITLIIFFTNNSFSSNKKFSDKLYTSLELNNDLDFLIKKMETIHPNIYYSFPKENFLLEIEQIKKRLVSPMTRLEFSRKLIPLVVKLNDGHTFLDFPFDEYIEYLDNGGSVFPLGVKIINNSIFVEKNTFLKNIPKNSEIISINGIDSKSLLKQLREYVSGERIDFKNKRIENKFLEYLWWVFKFENDFIIEYKTNDNKVNIIKKGITLDEYKNKKEELKEEIPEYKYKDYLFYTINENKIGIIEFNSFSNQGEFKIFLKETFNYIRKNNINKLIIDIRKNGGGNSYLGNMLIEYLTEKPYQMFQKIEEKISNEVKESIKGNYLSSKYENGKIYSYDLKPIFPPKNKILFKGDIYLLTSNYTFSSAADLASVFKCFKLGKIIGEETGGLTVSYGDIIYQTLPNTKLNFGVSFKKFVNPCGKENGHGIIPDYLIVSDKNNDKDKIMEYTINLIKNKK